MRAFAVLCNSFPEVAMKTQEKLANLVKVQTALAEKYERLARTVRSKPRRKSMLHHAALHRQKAKDASRGH
jgi:hypothetical protein